ncbi:M20/M25/M40 family metallo-hydrolase [Aliiglaciecola sp. LCG003]|uniref:M20/M25/M40 family metallo-hydrolase n=1 Tax=Aliiglaciecola sp. LCG003 TaxID=3053655 RepID=UPI0025726E4A|nr:M20/M25/M40 family metallo-hydrolase [Aliiglaciecola sp. LCG003]WJG10817.1 M28 family peptidase [Aliiglaciecola sp. LCG003]
MTSTTQRASSIISLILTLIIIATLLLSWQSQIPSQDASFNIGGSQFSSDNAQRHIQTTAQHPHYSGSAQHEQVRQYIVEQLTKLGLDVQIQSALSINSNYPVAAQVLNIVARIPAQPNSNSEHALALISHYDSSLASSLGASDAGSGVAVILEGVRTFLASKLDQQNDIYIVITDAEEIGLLGAEAFVKSHPWAKNITLALNFEARGSGGPSYTLLETNGGNRQLIQAYAAAGITHPNANSLMYSIYKMLPNDTDLTVLREQGNIKGFNFAFIDDHFDYHTAQDSAARLDKNTLNHQIDYITALLPYFANADLSQLDSDDDNVYFNFGSLALYDYPFSWVLPMALLVTLVFVMMCINGIKMGKLTVNRILTGYLPLFLSIGVATLIGLFGWQGLLLLYPQFQDITQGFPYTGHYIIACGILLTITATALIYSWLINRFDGITSAQWYVSIISVWIVINLLLSIFLTGAGFFIIMAIAPLAIFSSLLRDNESANRNAIMITLFSLPGLVIITPQIPVFVIGLGLSNLAIATIISVLVFVTLIPLFFVLKGIRSIQLFMLAGAIISFVGISLHADYSAERKKPSSVNYLYDADKQQAYLFSYNRQLDSFTEQFFNEQNRVNLLNKDVFPISRRRQAYFTTEVAALPLQGSGYMVKRTSLENGIKRLSITIEPNRQLHNIKLMADSPIKLRNMSINEQDYVATNPIARKFVFQLNSIHKQSISVTFDYTDAMGANQSAAQPIFNLIETSYDLPQQWPGFKPREEHLMPSTSGTSDATIISQKIAFD